MVCKGFSKRVWLGSLSGVWSLEEQMGASSKSVVTHKPFKVCFKLGEGGDIQHRKLWAERKRVSCVLQQPS